MRMNSNMLVGLNAEGNSLNLLDFKSIYLPMKSFSYQNVKNAVAAETTGIHLFS